MNELKTPNLGLNKIERSSPSTTYFDLDKYLDQNWEKVDDFAEQVEEKAEETSAQVSSIQERLDTEKRRSVTLEPGVQIINSERASAFKLEGLKGRTLVNLLGRDGECESTAPFSLIYGSASPTSFVTSTTDRTEGVAGIRATWDSENTGTSRSFMIPTKLAAGKYYIAIADLSTSNVGMAAFIAVRKGDGSYHEGSRVSSITKSLSFVSFQADGTELATGIYCVVRNLTGNIAFDSIRLYEIDSVQLNNLTRMSNEMIASSYPYVDSVQPVRNPYAIRYGENLLPPLYDWTNQTGSAAYSTINGPYDVTIISPDPVARFYSYVINVVPGKTYTLNAEADANKIQWDYYKTWDSVTATGEQIGSRDKFIGSETTFVVPSGATMVRMYLFNDEVAGTFNIKNTILTIGNATKPFTPREDVMLALQTDLYADPLTGANADQVFERGGQYFKLAKWNRTVLEGALSYVFLNNYVGFKRVTIPVGQLPLPLTSQKYCATKYQGDLLKLIDTASAADALDYSSTYGWIFSVSNADSGWGDSYTPTADEIKVYFMGWRMANSSDGGGPYNGTGTKAWKNILRYHDSGGEKLYSLPTTNVPNWTPYQLLYQLATPTVEPITAEGQLTFFDGDNQIEVSTGIVLRESIKPIFATDYYQFNDTTLAGSTLKNKLSKPLSMYRNNQLDYGWEFVSDQYAYGAYKARKVPARYDVSAAYSITYLMLDTSLAVAFVGSVADNEKALLTDLVQDVQQANARLSVVENKKAEKDVPAWITPTLLNGWVNYSVNDYPSVGLRKDSEGNVSIRGLITGGSIVSGVSLFILPVGYRPSKYIMFTVTCSDGTTPTSALVNIAPNGTVSLNRVSQNNFVTLFLPPFQAEQ